MRVTFTPLRSWRAARISRGCTAASGLAERASRRKPDRVERALMWVCSIPLLLGGAYVAGFRYNDSPSVPRGFYLTRAVDMSELRRGSYVCLVASADAAPASLRDWARGRSLPVLLKSVAGLRGDVVEYSELAAQVVVNGQPLSSSTLRTRGSDGRVLPRPRYPFRLQRDQVWLASSHPLGVDSRYFGPVNVSSLSCLAEPLWTF